MIPDRDVWAAALLMVKRYGDDAISRRGAPNVNGPRIRIHEGSAPIFIRDA
jgi:hypothetical protein